MANHRGLCGYEFLLPIYLEIKIPLKGMRLVQRDVQIPVGWIGNFVFASEVIT